MGTRYDAIMNGMSIDDLSEMLCRATEANLLKAGDEDYCDHCMAFALCKRGETGFKVWLLQEVKNGKDV